MNCSSKKQEHLGISPSDLAQFDWKRQLRRLVPRVTLCRGNERFLIFKSQLGMAALKALPYSDGYGLVKSINLQIAVPDYDLTYQNTHKIREERICVYK